jgi:LPS sulfotransferase NodH
MLKPTRLFLRSQVTPYVILFIERDGSTYLSSLLMNHPHIHAVYERFAVMQQKGASAQEQLEWADRFLTPNLVGRWGAVGFKTKLVDVLDRQRFITLLQEKGCQIIHMSRKNTVKAVISKINARRLYEASGHWNLYTEKNRMPPMIVDLTEIDELLIERQEAEHELEEYIAHLSLPTMKIAYEDLLVARDQTIGEVLDFLGVGAYRLNESTLKHTSDDLRDVVDNFDSLERHLSGTAYHPMLTERLLHGGG